MSQDKAVSEGHTKEMPRPSAGWVLSLSCGLAALLAMPVAHAQEAPPAAAASSASAADTPAADSTARPKGYTVPAGTKVLLSLKSAVNTKTAQAGDSVYLISDFPVVVGNRVLIPSGIYVQGQVDRVVRPGRVKGRAQLEMHFTSMIFPNGTVISIPGSVNSVPGSDGPKVTDKEGTIEQAGTKGKDLGTIAKTTAAGAGLGSIAGIDGHPAEGAGYGAAGGAVGGLLYTLFSRGPDLNIPAGSSVEMVLQRSLELEAGNLEPAAPTRAEPTVSYSPAPGQQQPLPKPAAHIVCPPGSDCR